jgi:hypothetical protein
MAPFRVNGHDPVEGPDRECREVVGQIESAAAEQEIRCVRGGDRLPTGRCAATIAAAEIASQA